MTSATPSSIDHATALTIGRTIVKAEIVDGNQEITLDDGTFIFVHNGNLAHGGFE
jgi:hypothetical protein